MGTDNLQPYKFADVLRESAAAFLGESSGGGSSAIDPVFHVETSYGPRPYTVQLSESRAAGGAAAYFPPQSPPLHTAFILFSAMRPLSFVRVDAFTDRVLHVPSVRIVLVALEVDVTGSDNAVATLRDSSRCRPVAFADVQRYVALKRRWLREKDEQELAQEMRWAGSSSGGGAGGSDALPFRQPRTLSVFVVPPRRNRLLENAVQDFFTSASGSSAVSGAYASPSSFEGTFSLSATAAASPTTKHRYLFRLFRFCFASDEPQQHMHLIGAAEEHSGDDENTPTSDEPHRKGTKKKRSRNAQRAHQQRTWNDEHWQKDWRHEVESAAEFYAHQRQLFSHHVAAGLIFAPAAGAAAAAASSHGPPSADADAIDNDDAVTAARREAEEWVVLSFRGAAGGDHPFAAAAAAAAPPPPAAGDLARSSALFSSSHSLRRKPSGGVRSDAHASDSSAGVSPVPVSVGGAAASAPHALSRHTSFVTFAPSASSVQEAEAQPQQSAFVERFAFWNPRTGDISLSVPKALVLHRQSTAAVVHELLADRRHRGGGGDGTGNGPEKEEEDGAAVDELSLLRCPPHLVRKATLAAAEQRRENARGAERMHAQRLGVLQQRLAAAERRHHELQAAKRASEQALQALRQQREHIKQRVYDVQRRRAAAQTQLGRDEVFATLSSEQRQRAEAAEARLEEMQRLAQLSDWKARQARKRMLEIEQYEAMGGRAEYTRRYLARFTENKYARADLERAEQRGAAVQAEIDALVAAELAPRRQRRRFLEQRKAQLLREIEDVVRSDMAATPSLALFLHRMAQKNRRRRRRFPYSEVAGLNASDNYDNDDERFLDDNSDDELERFFGRRHRRGSANKKRMAESSSSSSTETDDARGSNYVSELDSSSSDSNSSSSSSSSSSSDAASVDGATKPRPARRLFEVSIRRLRRAMRTAQFVLAEQPVPGVFDLRPAKLCKSVVVSDCCLAAAAAFPDAAAAAAQSESLTAWIDEFNAEVPLAVTAVTISASSAIPDLRHYAATVAHRRWVVLQVQEHIERRRIALEESARVVQTVWAAAVVHLRNLGSRSIKHAKAKRKALFGPRQS